MKRRLLNSLNVLSLLLCVAVVAMWVRGYFTSDFAGVERRENSQDVARYVFSSYGVFGYGWSIRPAGGLAEARGLYHHAIPGKWNTHSRLVPEANAYVTLHYPPPSPPTTKLYTVPCWILFLALALPSVLAFRRFRQSRRQTRRGFCPACGYDLRATPQQCPECGIIPSEPT